ncbi:MAG: hypothetical protein ACUBOA_00990 [Candidatus Loosdrechtia sp.]|uniref:hypothetical protein n=1 Tax=Candidatus Loosdrechtia sp. TaxID=3101272 RepID=UPI003A6897B0|nr:MAG: AAA family ATPase [Candidatus Jettenia sp. AMX2]
MAKDLRCWLAESDFLAEQREPLELSEKQLSYVTTRTDSGYRRIKGPAGTGKSLVLVARAAKLFGEGKEVLVVTYNITLLHYLKGLAARWPAPPNVMIEKKNIIDKVKRLPSDVMKINKIKRLVGNLPMVGRVPIPPAPPGKTGKNITWLNFHHWCKRVCQECNREEEYKVLWNEHPREEVLDHRLPELVSQIIDEDKANVIPRYDAVLVDEGQDFLPGWWNALRKVCRKEGEMLLVADATQDIYGTAKAWTDEKMTGAGFSGKFGKLEISYRLPPKALKYAREFAEQFLPQDNVDPPVSVQGELDLYPCKLRWIQTNADQALRVCTNEILSMAPNAGPGILAIPDITFLTGINNFGREVVARLDEQGVRVIHTFTNGNNDREARRRRMHFYARGVSGIRATTLHSFKGWESRALVVYVDPNAASRSLALIYTGLTRIKRHVGGGYLTVVSCAQNLREYGRTWPEYSECH